MDEIMIRDQQLDMMVLKAERTAEYEFEETVSVLIGVWAYLMLGITIGTAFCQFFGIVGGG